MDINANFCASSRTAKQFNLLVDKLIITQITDSQYTNIPMSLPEVLAALHDENKEIVGFKHLQAYQIHAWYAFLTQLSAIVRSHHPEIEQIELTYADKWLVWLRAITNNYPDDSPWLLLNDCLDSPAFMQLPVAEGNLDEFKTEVTPDLIDILVLSKNHDVKYAKIQSPHPSHWIFALISLQTMGGFSGKENYGISRMNKGYGNRSCVTLVRNPFSWGLRLREDVNALLEWRNKTCNTFSFKESKGITLLWLEKWTGNTSLQLHQLDPFYIEICRRLRLKTFENKILCFRKSTKKRLVEAESWLGNVGDPWLIIEDREQIKQENSSDKPLNDSTKSIALTVQGTGFNYRLTQKLLFDPAYKWTPVQKGKASEKGGWCLMRSLVRGQGETEGYHERLIPIPSKYYNPMGSTKHEEMAKRSEEMVKMSGEYQKILKDTLLAFFQGINDLTGKSIKQNSKDKRATQWINNFDKEVDKLYFSHLWLEVDENATEPLRGWRELLERLVKEQFNNVVYTFAKESSRYFKNRAEAERRLCVLLKKQKNK